MDIVSNVFNLFIVDGGEIGEDWTAESSQLTHCPYIPSAAVPAKDRLIEQRKQW